MKHIISFIIGLFLCIPMFSQQPNVSQTQRDSILIQMGKYFEKCGQIGRYKVYPTNNTYTSLKLDTATGGIWALQIGIGTTDRLSYRIVAPLEDEPETYIIGRYELYPANNNYNLSFKTQ